MYMYISLSNSVLSSCRLREEKRANKRSKNEEQLASVYGVKNERCAASCERGGSRHGGDKKINTTKATVFVSEGEESRAESQNSIKKDISRSDGSQRSSNAYISTRRSSVDSAKSSVSSCSSISSRGGGRMKSMAEDDDIMLFVKAKRTPRPSNSERQTRTKQWRCESCHEPFSTFKACCNHEAECLHGLQQHKAKRASGLAMP